MNIFRRLYYNLLLWEAIRKADAAHRSNRTRYYVIPAGGPRHRLIVIDRKNFRRLRLKHYIHPSALVRHLEAECFYHTPHADGSGMISLATRTRKRRAYIRWCRQ